MAKLLLDLPNGVLVAIITGFGAFIIMWIEVNKNIKTSKFENERQFYFQVEQNSATEMLKLLNSAIENVDELRTLERKYSHTDKEKWYEVAQSISSNLDDLRLYIYYAPIKKQFHHDSVTKLLNHKETVKQNLFNIERITYAAGDQSTSPHIETGDDLREYLFFYREELTKEYGEKIETDMRNIDKESRKIKWYKKLQSIPYFKTVMIVIIYFSVSYCIISDSKLSDLQLSLLLSLIVGAYLYLYEYYQTPQYDEVILKEESKIDQ